MLNTPAAVRVKPGCPAQMTWATTSLHTSKVAPSMRRPDSSTLFTMRGFVDSATVWLLSSMSSWAATTALFASVTFSNATSDVPPYPSGTVNSTSTEPEPDAAAVKVLVATRGVAAPVVLFINVPETVYEAPGTRLV